MNNDLQESKTHITARRRLVRGVFAAPAALTLYSGGAFAAASVSCVAKEVASPTYPALDPAPTDTYVRVRLWTLPSTTPSAWVRGADVTALQIPNTPAPYIFPSEWQCYAVGTPAEVIINALPVTPTAGTRYGDQPTISSNIAPTQNGSYAALRVDSNGMIVGVVDLGEGGNSIGSAVHQSCWASFKPAP